MKVTNTVLHLETEQEKQMLIKAVAREIVDRAAVASVDDGGYEAESNLIPQFEQPIPVAAISEAELEDIEPAECTCNHNDDKQEPQSAFSTLRSYLFKHRNSDRVTPVYVSMVPTDEEDAEAKKAAVIGLMKAMAQADDEDDKKEAVRNFINNIPNHRLVDEDHVFTCEDGRQVVVPESLLYHIKNNI